MDQAGADIARRITLSSLVLNRGGHFCKIHDVGASMLIGVDADGTGGTNPARFTVALSGIRPDAGAVRYDDADLVRAVRKAVDDFNRLQALVVDQLLERGFLADRIQVGVGLCGGAKLL
jgi:hypothetical protein